MTITLLGPQRFKPTLAAALAAQGVSGPVATVTAGWQERELDDAEIDEALGGKSVNLRLHARGEEVFGADASFKEAHRRRQERLQVLQDLYRLRLEHALDAARAVARRVPDAATLVDEWKVTIDGLRDLDRVHLDRVRAELAEFDARLLPAERPAVVRARKDIAAAVEPTEALVIAGGHVAVLLNRLKLFDLGALVGGRPVFAITGGAMCIAERVVLFHDSPPQGAGIAQILDDGLGLVPDIVPLPSPRQRLRLDDHERVSMFARRFAPAACVALDDGAQLTFKEGRFGGASLISRLDAGGGIDTAWAA